MVNEAKIVLKSVILTKSELEDLAAVLIEDLQRMECVVQGKVLVTTERGER